MKLAVGPPLVTPGERMAYRLTLRGMELGSFGIAVGDIVELGGKRAVQVQAQAKSSGLAKMVADVDDRFISWVDVETGRPVRFEVYEQTEKNSTDRDHVVVDFAARDGDHVPIHYGINDEPQKTLQQKVSQPEVWDYNAFLLALRSWEGKPGSTATLEVFRSRYLWRIVVTLGHKGTLVTELGELPVIRFDAHTVKLDRNGVKWVGQEERDFSVWISDDDGRVPLKLDAKTDYGAVMMDIVEYQPGTGQRLRP